MSTAIKGADVSAFQGRLDAGMLRDAGLSFLYVRCQVGNNPSRDAVFAADVAAAREAGVFVGPYHFAFPLPHLDPQDQADRFHAAAFLADEGGEGHVLGSADGELPPALDLEWPPPEEWAKRGCTADQIVDWGIACVDAMKANTGRSVVLYSYPYFLQKLSTAARYDELVGRCRLWIAGGAQYLNGDGHVPDLARERPPVVKGWGADWMFWQYDGDGGARLPRGVDSDFNVFNGDLEALERLCTVERANDPPDDTTEVLATLARIQAAGLVVEDAVHANRQERAEAIVASGI